MQLPFQASKQDHVSGRFSTLALSTDSLTYIHELGDRLPAFNNVRPVNIGRKIIGKFQNQLKVYDQ
jgi:hypothetical protein